MGFVGYIGSLGKRIADDLKLSKTVNEVDDNRKAQAICSWHVSSEKNSIARSINRELQKLEQEVGLLAREELATRRLKLREKIENENLEHEKELNEKGLAVFKDRAY